MTVPEPRRLSGHHQLILERIERHPTAHNLEWDDVIAMLREVADVQQQHDGKFTIEMGGERLVLTRPRTKDIDAQMVSDLRKMLRNAGVLPTA